MAPKKFFNYRQNRPWAENLQIVAQLGLTMAGSIIFCLFVGRFLDGWLGTPGIFTVLFIIFGIIGGAVVVYRQIMEILEPDTRDRSESGDNNQHPPHDPGK
ncbi:MAG: AtpZ/AtpI family protein [Desulfobacterales bacterium]